MGEGTDIELNKGKLELEIKRLELDQLRAKRDSNWTSPLVVTLVTGVVGIFATGIANYVQSRATLSANIQKAQADQELERQRNEGSLILKSIDTQDPTKAAKLLVFLAKNGIIRDPNHKITALEENPEAAPTLPTSAAGTVYVNPCKSDLVPYVASRLSKLITEAHRAHIRVRIDRGCRSIEEQARLYAYGRTLPGPRITNTRPGTSVHNCGLAFDLAVIDVAGNDIDRPDDERWQKIGSIARTVGLEWGGDWRPLPDATHFQQPRAKCQVEIPDVDTTDANAGHSR